MLKPTNAKTSNGTESSQMLKAALLGRPFYVMFLVF